MFVEKGRLPYSLEAAFYINKSQGINEVKMHQMLSYNEYLDKSSELKPSKLLEGNKKQKLLIKQNIQNETEIFNSCNDGACTGSL